jgi:hypothetical protein
MRRLLSVALAVALLTAACSSTSVEDAEGAYCDSLQALFDSVFAAQELTSASTVEEAEEAADAVRSAYDDVVAAAGDYTDAQISEIESAREGFDDAVSEIPDSATLAMLSLRFRPHSKASSRQWDRPLTHNALRLSSSTVRP